MKKVITYGTFDLFHNGHYRLLQRAKALGDYLIVGVTAEHFDKSRGKLNIVESLFDRMQRVRETGFADEIIIEDHIGQKIEDIKKYDIDLFVMGSDWRGKYDYLSEYCKVKYLKRTRGIFSSIRHQDSLDIIRLGIIGSGRKAEDIMSEAKFVSGINIEGVYNPQIKFAKNFTMVHELCFATDNEEDFYDHIDAVYVASPTQTHYAYAKNALQHGKHVLCEAPLVLNKMQAEKLFSLAAQRECIIMEAVDTAYFPGFLQLIKMVKGQVIGKICDVEASFTKLTNSHLREMNDKETGGSFLEFGSCVALVVIKLLNTDYENVTFDSFLADNGIDYIRRLISSIKMLWLSPRRVSR